LIESNESTLEDWTRHGCIYQEQRLSSFEPEDISIYSENDDEDGEEGVEMGAPHVDIHNIMIIHMSIHTATIKIILLVDKESDASFPLFAGPKV